MAPIWYDGGSFKLYFYNRETHRRPHVAVMAGRRRLATIDLVSGEVLAGELAPQQHRKITALLAEHADQAVVAFEAALRQEPIDRLDPKHKGGGES